MTAPVAAAAVDSAKIRASGHAAQATPSIDKETLRRLMQPSLWRWSIRVGGDWLVIIVPIVVAGLTRHWAAFVLAPILIGIGQHRVALMAHEGTHRQACRNKRLNDFLTGFFCLWPFGNPVGGYRRFHFTHHRWLNTEADCELHQKAKSAPAWDLPATRWTLLKYAVRDVCLLHVIELKHLSRRVRPGTSWYDGTMPNIWLLLAAGSLLYFGQWWVIVVWYLGTAIVFWPIYRLRVWTEHVGTHEAHRIRAPWSMRLWLLPHSTECHYEHHLYPQVPCWHLQRVRKLLGNDPPVIPLFALLEIWERAPRVESGATAPPAYVPAFDTPPIAEFLTE